MTRKSGSYKKDRNREWRERKHSDKSRNSHMGFGRQNNDSKDVEYSALAW